MAFCTAMKFFSRLRLSGLRRWRRRRVDAKKIHFPVPPDCLSRARSIRALGCGEPVSGSSGHSALPLPVGDRSMISSTPGRATRSILASITFDDGYTDNLTTASPILRRAGIPATFFICTGYLGDVRGFWWDRVASAIAATDIAAPSFELTKEISLTGDLSSPDGRHRATLEIAGRLQRMHPLAKGSCRGGTRARPARRDQLARGSRARSWMRQECENSARSRLRNLAHIRTVIRCCLSSRARNNWLRSFAAPRDFRRLPGPAPGSWRIRTESEQDYTEDSCLAAKAAALEAAFVNHGGPFDPKRQPYRVPRYYVPPLPADDFRGWLHRVIDQ